VAFFIRWGEEGDPYNRLQRRDRHGITPCSVYRTVFMLCVFVLLYELMRHPTIRQSNWQSLKRVKKASPSLPVTGSSMNLC